MVHLSLAGRSEDGKQLRLVSDAGVEFTLDVDARLRAALREEPARPGPLETTMDSALRPRDIQARIRAGESPEALADAAGTSVDKVMVYAGPVLAERAHVAERAQRSSVRRRSTAGTAGAGARTLGEAVAEELRRRNVPESALSWDAWRREDGRWTLLATVTPTGPSAEGPVTGRFTYDGPGNYVQADDDDARGLVGEAPLEPPAPPVVPGAAAGPASVLPATGPAASAPRDPRPTDEVERARRRRLASAAPADEPLPLGSDALDLVTGPAHPEPDPRPPRRPSIPPVPSGPEPGPDPAPAAPTRPAAGDAAPGPDGAGDGTGQGAGDDAGDQAPATPRRASKKSRRASVPSWDEIMFGGGQRD